MVKRNVTLYGDAENVEIALAKGINLSQLFNEMLKVEIEAKPETDEELIKNLKARNVFLATELKNVRKEKNKIERGIIRDGSESDVSACVNILNAYEASTSITQIWTELEFKSIISNKGLLDDTPFSVFFYVWDVDGEIKGFVLGRYEVIVYGAGKGLSAIIIHTGFTPPSI